MEEYNAQPIWHGPSAVRCVHSDASDVGYGGAWHASCTGMWTPEEAKRSSTWRELVAVGRVLGSVAGRLSNTQMLVAGVHSDAKPIWCWLSCTGGRRREFTFCLQGISIYSESVWQRTIGGAYHRR